MELLRKSSNFISNDTEGQGKSMETNGFFLLFSKEISYEKEIKLKRLEKEESKIEFSLSFRV